MIYLSEYPNIIRQEDNCTVHLCPNCYENDGVERYTLKIYNNDFGVCFRCNERFKIAQNKNNLLQEKRKPKFDRTTLSNIILDNDRLKYFNTSKIYDSNGIRYLESRNPKLKTDYTKFKIRFTSNSVLIPFYYNNELIYYQERTFPDKRYKNLSGIPIPLYIAEKKSKYIILSEGVFDAIACYYLFPTFTSCGVIGSSISAIQIAMLKKLNPRLILIYLDEPELSNKVKNKLQKEFLCQISCIHYPGYKDPETYFQALN